MKSSVNCRGQNTRRAIPEPEVTDLWDAAAHVASVDDFKAWIRRAVREVLPHGALACGYGRVHAAGVSMDYVLTVDYPLEHLESIRNAAGCIDTPLMVRWMQERHPVLFDADDPWPDLSPAWLESFRRHGLDNAAVHASYDRARAVGTYFSFHRLPDSPGQTERAILAGITPLLHETLLRVIANLETEPFPGGRMLSEREREIALQVGQGKNNQEIAQALGMAETSVRNHVVGILEKTGNPNCGRLIAAINASQRHNGTRML